MCMGWGNSRVLWGTKATISLKRIWRTYRNSPTLFRTVPSPTPYTTASSSSRLTTPTQNSDPKFRANERWYRNNLYRGSIRTHHQRSFDRQYHLRPRFTPPSPVPLDWGFATPTQNSNRKLRENECTQRIVCMLIYRSHIDIASRDRVFWGDRDVGLARTDQFLARPTPLKLSQRVSYTDFKFCTRIHYS